MAYIGITGKIGSGKSTAASILRDCAFTERTFAEPLKSCALAFGFSYSEIYGSQAEKSAVNTTWGISGREFLQKFGTEVCREQLPRIIPTMNNCWVKLATSNIVGNIVWSDVRFPDEAAAIKELGGIIIEIVRPSNYQMFHTSETQQIQSDMTIDNSGTIDDLRNNLHIVLTNYLV
jgi:hypothetical protein